MNLRPIVFLIFALSTSAAVNAAPRLLVLDVKTRGESEEGSAQLLTALTAQALSDVVAAEILSPSDLSQILSVEAMKQAADCDENQCLSEIADALNARFIVSGEVGKLGEVIVYQLKIFDQSKSAVVARQTMEAATNDGLRTQMRMTVTALVAPLVKSGELQARTVEKAQASASTLGWTLAGVGALGAIATGIAFGFGELQLDNEAKSLESRQAWRNAGPWLAAGIGMSVVVMGAGLGNALVAE